MKFIKNLNQTKFSIGGRTVLATTSPPNHRYTINYSALATIKELLATMTCSTEIGWSGVVERVSDTDFLVKDILIFPQTVSGTSYRTDDKKYAEWIQTLNEGQYNNLRLNGHSHVYMSVRPSTMDLELQSQTVKMLPETDYYIFTIKNKTGKAKYWIYDLKNNVVVDENNIDVHYLHEGDEYYKFVFEQIPSMCSSSNPFTYKTNSGSTISSLDTLYDNHRSKRSKVKFYDENLEILPCLSDFPDFEEDFYDEFSQEL